MSRLADLIVAVHSSKHTRRAYAARLREFLADGYPLTREGVAEWLIYQRDTRLRRAPACNQALSAIKKLAQEAELRGLINGLDARGIRLLNNQKVIGSRMGNWLTLAGSQRLRSLPDRRYIRGRRDAVIFALLLGCGLRREEACKLTWANYGVRDDRMCLIDIDGKGGRRRSVPIPNWARIEIDAWKKDMKRKVLDAPTDVILHPVNISRLRMVCCLPKPLSPQGLWCIVTSYAEKVGMPNLSAHDLRRTWARLMRKAGAKWEDIMQLLGHSNISTTQKYVGMMDLEEGINAVDLVQWD